MTLGAEIDLGQGNTIQPGGIVTVGHRLIVGIARQPRARCAKCHTRRVLYRVVVAALIASGDMTEARCAPCWGDRRLTPVYDLSTMGPVQQMDDDRNSLDVIRRIAPALFVCLDDPETRHCDGLARYIHRRPCPGWYAGCTCQPILVRHPADDA